MSELIFEEESYQIRGTVFEVYREIGCGFLESVYQECLAREFTRTQIPFKSQPLLELEYKGEKLDQVFKPDFMCFDKIIIEIKAVKEIAPEHIAQTINYLKVTKTKLGFLINFGSHPKATIKRIVL